ncbi:MAG: glycosyltransferase family 2 protein [Hyphomicrobiaceae bacterium]
MAAPRHIDVSILVVSYNTRELTLACLDSIVAETRDVVFEVIVVDNASNDGSAEALAGHPAVTKLIALEDNIGFARANNLAAAEAEGGLLLLLNPDTVVLDRAIDRLAAFARLCPHARIWGGRTCHADGTLNPASFWRRMTPWNLFCRASGLTGLLPSTTLFNGEAEGGDRRDHIRYVDIVSGAFLMIDRGMWRQLGGFDPEFFMYGEEADLCLRARSHGAAPLVTPAATIIHLGGASEHVREDKMVRLLAAKALLIERHFAPGTRRLGRTLNALWPLSRLLVFAIAGVATGSASLRDKAAVWQRIWSRRAEWIGGYRSGRMVVSPRRRALGRLATSSG